MPTLIEKLRQIANAKPGDPMPECLLGPDGSDINWGPPLAQIAKAAADALEFYEGDPINDFTSSAELGKHLLEVATTRAPPQIAVVGIVNALALMAIVLDATTGRGTAENLVTRQLHEQIELLSSEFARSKP